jgi:hypothetical protein
VSERERAPAHCSPRSAVPLNFNNKTTKEASLGDFAKNCHIIGKTRWAIRAFRATLIAEFGRSDKSAPEQRIYDKRRLGVGAEPTRARLLFDNSSP